MPWWVWLIVALVASAAVAVIAFAALRRSLRGRKFLDLPARGKLRFGRALLADRDAPLLARLAIVLVVAYLALPFDLIPDFIPVLGQADDVAVVVVVVAILLWLLPQDRFDAALRKAGQGMDGSAPGEAARGPEQRARR